MTTIDWNCRTVDVYLNEDDHQNVVYNVYWIVTGTSDQLDTEGNPYSAYIDGQQTLNISNINEFIPFEDLTNATVTRWVKDTMGAPQVAILESNIRNNIDGQINPITAVMEIQN